MQSISDLSNTEFTLAKESCTGQSISFKGLKNVKISLNGIIGAVYIYDCLDCDVYIAQVKGACNIYQCKNSKLRLICHQMRINESQNLTVQARILSDPAIVESTNIKFTKYLLQEELKDVLGENNFENIGNDNTWKNVKDFSSLHGGDSGLNYEILD
jgi:Tubulin binding cofactor C